ncbi:MAG: ATP-binding protein [Nanoarchaeota archaeon]|nr:ATP-binding protein [Nanoarchaeota archaeon]
MDVSEQIKRFEHFIEQDYHVQLLEAVSLGNNFMVIDFVDLSKFDPELADLLLDQPEEVMKAFEIAIKNLDVPESVTRFFVRFKNIPKSQEIKIRDIRSLNIDRLICLNGLVRQKSDVRPQVTTARFECPSCGNIMSVIQLEAKFKEPSRCGCGRKGKFRLVSKELVDAQKIVLEEIPENLEGGDQPKRIDIFLKNDLVSTLSDKKTNPGTKVHVVGQVKEVPIPSKDGGKLVRFDLMIDSNFVEPLEESFGDITIKEEEEKKIIELSRDPKILNKLVNSMAPSIYGHDKVKEAIILQLLGGVRKVRTDGVVTRGDMHILLVGDPGAGKCLHKDSKLVLSDGSIVRVGELVDCRMGKLLGDGGYACSDPFNVVSFDENAKAGSNTSRVVWRRKEDRLLKIRTKTGNSIVVTKNHPFFTANNGFIVPKAAEEMKEGDFIASPSKIVTQSAMQPCPTDFLRSRGGSKVSIRIPHHIDGEIARVLGYLVGDGWLRLKEKGAFVSLTNNNEAVLSDFKRILEDKFGVRVTRRRPHSGKSAEEAYTTSIEFARLLEKIDSRLYLKSAGKTIPQAVNRSPEFVMREFLRALFECDAHVRKGRRQIELVSKSRDLIEDVKIALLRFGVISTLSQKRKCATNTAAKIVRDYYELRISGVDVIAYGQKIGFFSKDKTGQLDAVMAMDRVFNTNIRVVPGLKEILRFVRLKHGLSQFDFGISRSSYQHYEKGDRNPSFGHLKQIVDEMDSRSIDGFEIGLLKGAAESDVFWDAVASKEEIDNDGEYVYDIQVDNTHNFVSNAIIVHNSQLIKRAQLIAPKSRYVSGKGASGAGLTAAVVRDEFLRGWALEAGALVLANKGFCMIDEMDKMSKEDRDAMHEALEQQTVSISKANIQATLRCETTVLAAANPKWGRFDPYEILGKQIDLPPALISRFDLIFPIRDLPNREHDEKLAGFVLNLHQTSDAGTCDIETDMLRKYIAYARRNCVPKLTDGAMEEIKAYYVKMRGSGGEEGGIKAIPITARQLEGLVRLAEASARSRLSDKVTKRDSRKAIELLHFCMSQIGIDPDTGKIDVDVLTTGVSSSARSHIIVIKEVINDLENKIGKTIPVEDVIRESQDKGVSADKAEEVIEKLKRAGDIFEPKRGFIQKI